MHTHRYTFILLFTLLCIPLFAFATEFVPLSPNLPIIERNMDPGDMKGLLNAFLVIAVAVSAILAVIMIAIGGFKYMTTDSVFAISGAKEQIANAIIGLLIVLSAVLIMYTINPKIVQLDVFEANSTQ